MKELQPDYYFDLTQFSHAALLEEENYVWDALKKLKDYLSSVSLGNIEVSIPDDVYLEKPQLISIGSGTQIEPGAYIKGPCWIGKESVIRQGAYIRGDVLTGDRVVIGHDTEIKHSILLNEARAAHFNYVGDSILGNRANLGAGMKCANFKLDKKTIQIIFQNQKIDTGMRKLGAIIGDDVQIGCNSVLNPGTCLGREIQCHPCLNVGGFFPSRSIIKGVVQTYKTV